MTQDKLPIPSKDVPEDVADCKCGLRITRRAGDRFWKDSEDCAYCEYMGPSMFPRPFHKPSKDVLRDEPSAPTELLIPNPEDKKGFDRGFRGGKMAAIHYLENGGEWGLAQRMRRDLFYDYSTSPQKSNAVSG